VTAALSECLVCGGGYVPSPIAGLLKCSRCGFTSANLSLSADELAAIYGPDYFHGGEYRDYAEEAASLRHNFRLRLETLRKVVQDLARRDLFEIGCAYGFFLDEARSFVRSASGIDISASAVQYASRELHADAREGDYLKAELGRKFGAIVMWDTIEHLGRPDLYLAKIRADLEGRGFVAFTTGDIGSLNARWRGRRWRMIHPPSHLHYFSVDTATALLKRTGFEVVHVSHPGNSRNLKSMLHNILVLRMGWPAAYEAVRNLRWLDMHVSLNLADIMFVIARRV
jgi:predicted TPR repeat methyltransferase